MICRLCRQDGPRLDGPNATYPENPSVSLAKMSWVNFVWTENDAHRHPRNEVTRNPPTIGLGSRNKLSSAVRRKREQATYPITGPTKTDAVKTLMAGPRPTASLRAFVFRATGLGQLPVRSRTKCRRSHRLRHKRDEVNDSQYVWTQRVTSNSPALVKGAEANVPARKRPMRTEVILRPRAEGSWKRQ